MYLKVVENFVFLGCEAVFHESCFKDMAECPRCSRIRLKKEQRTVRQADP
jgi:hypothetical protein